MAKAFVTQTVRNSVKMAGDILTNDEEYMMRAMDMETVFTYEGTYDINALVAGATLTGIPTYKL